MLKSINIKQFLPLLGLTILLQVYSQTDDMIKIGDIYVDEYEAPNIEGESPFVMFTYLEAESWCEKRGKRLLTDIEWEHIAGGTETLPYVYGNDYNPTICNDYDTYLTPDVMLLNLWPIVISLDEINTFIELIDTVNGIIEDAASSAEEVLRLYKASGSGNFSDCVSQYGVFDLNGNVSEWTTRADGGIDGFHGNIKGGYWAEPRTIQSDITSQGDYFRDYYIGFRCAKDDPATLITKEHDKRSIFIFPNPATDKVYIKTEETATLQIFDRVGTMLKMIEDTQPLTEVDVTNLVPGYYLIRVISRENIYMKTFTIK